MKIEILFDKRSLDKNIRTGWGVSFLVDDKILLAEILYKLGETKLAIDKLTESLKYIDEKKENERIITLINKYKNDL